MRTMSAASVAMSVPAPMAIPTSACVHQRHNLGHHVCRGQVKHAAYLCQRGGVVDAITHHGHHLAPGLELLDLGDLWGTCRGSPSLHTLST
jgi:hypothetical protein